MKKDKSLFRFNELFLAISIVLVLGSIFINLVIGNAIDLIYLSSEMDQATEAGDFLQAYNWKEAFNIYKTIVVISFWVFITSIIFILVYSILEYYRGKNESKRKTTGK